MFKRDNFGDVMLSIAALIQPLLAVIQLILPLVRIMPVNAAALFRIIASAFFILIAFIWIIRRRIMLTLSLYFGIITLFLISMVQNPLNEQYIIDDGLKFTLATCAPVFLAYISIRDKSVFMNVLNVICKLLFIAGGLYTVIRLTGYYYVDSTYSMSYGYTLLLPAIYFLYKGTTKSICASILIAFMILLYGSRGPLVVYSAYIIWKLIDAKRWYYAVSISILLLFVSFFSQELLSLLNDWGFESRTLSLLNNLSFVSHDSGRQKIYENAYELINNSPMLGYGVFADRHLLNSAYVHNLFLELIIDFGPVLSFVLIIGGITWLIIKFISSSKMERELIIIFLLSTIIPLQFSGSYLTSFMFPLLLGVIYSSGEDNALGEDNVLSTDTLS